MKSLGTRQFTQGVLGTEPECFALAGLLDKIVAQDWIAQTLPSDSSSRLLSKHGHNGNQVGEWF